MFGEKDTKDFLDKRVKLVEERKKARAPLILPSQIDKEVKQFFSTSVASKTGRAKRLKMIKNLIFWGTDLEINKQNIDSYKTRSHIIESMLNVMFQNSLAEESDLIISSLKNFVFSREIDTGSRGELSPEVHQQLIKSVGRLLAAHLNEVERISHQNLDKMTKIQLIKELQKAKKDTGSLAFSGNVVKKDDQFKHKFPLTDNHVELLKSILRHFRYSGWPESRERAEELIASLHDHLGFDIN
jgi:hypothetical protein